MIDCQTAVVRTTAAFCHGSLVFQCFNLFNWEHGSAFTILITFPCNQGSSKSPHDTGDIRTDCLTVCDFFKTAQNGIIIEGSSLYDDMFSKFRGVGHLDDLKQCVFDHGIGKSCGDICNRSAFFLCLFYFGVHKYSTACSQIDRIFGIEGFLCKIFDCIIQ